MKKGGSFEMPSGNYDYIQLAAMRKRKRKKSKL